MCLSFFINCYCFSIFLNFGFVVVNMCIWVPVMAERGTLSQVLWKNINCFYFLTYLPSTTPFFWFLKFIYLFDHIIFHLQFPLLTLLIALLPFPSNLFRKGQMFHGYQQNKAYQVAVRLHTSHCIKAGQDNPIIGIGFQNWARVKDSLCSHC